MPSNEGPAVPSSLPSFDSSLIELRNDLGGDPAPCLCDSPFEVADVLLAIRDNDGSPSAAARELSLTLEQVYACVDCQREHPSLIEARLVACDFARHIDADDELFAPGELEIDAEPRPRWAWRLATR